MIVYRYRTLQATNEMVYVCRIGDTQSHLIVDDYKARFSKFDLHGQAIVGAVQEIVGEAMNRLVDSFNAHNVEACALRDLVRMPHEVQLLRIDRPFRTEEDARHHLLQDMCDILADTEYRAFTTTITLN